MPSPKQPSFIAASFLAPKNDLTHATLRFIVSWADCANWTNGYDGGWVVIFYWLPKASFGS
jgi:hypothetical protein